MDAKLEQRELLPCPFCGDEAAIFGFGPINPTFHVNCVRDNCCCGPDYRTRDEAITAWNTRAIQAQPAEGGVGLVDELQAVIREMDCDEKGKPYVYTQPSMVIWTEKWRGWVARLRAIAAAAPAAASSGEVEFEVWQGGAWQAGGSAPTLEDADREAAHYAMMYGQDGPEVTVKFYERREIAAPKPATTTGEGVGS